ncbi:MAG: hybrid sensor histidine kinase/response regulator [Calditrichales bacterium]|nr:MAG: hybrid sensor histidine kinase/response regulator [Calditrichales bacterium]
MPAANAKILVIEDEDQVRQSYEDMFDFFGYEVDSVSNGREGMSRITKTDYDIVVTDLNMPGMNGIEVLKYIKKKKPYIEVIVITGYATLENAIEAMKVGAYDYFSKPIDLDHVRIVLSKCVRQIQSKKENEALRSLTQQLKDLNELKDKFITITNHELRTPVTVLKGYIELIDYFLEDNKNPEIIEAIGIVSETMSELVGIVERMHDISTFDYGKKQMSMSDIDVKDILMVIQKEMKILYEKRKIELELIADDPAVILNGDMSQIKRCLRELLQNALKFTPEGGKVRMAYEINTKNKKLYIRVSDTGIGVPADKLDLIFEPFYEVQNVINHMTSKTEFMGGGIGLGLTLAKEVFNSHKGEILLESEVGKGSIFTVVLPYDRVLQSSPVQ